MMSGEKHAEMVCKGQVGAMLYVPNKKRRNELQRIAVEESRAGIPLLFGADVCHGYKTAFPISLAMAATWDPELLEANQRIAAKEARQDGLHWTFYPMLDVGNDVRWGRITEGNGEDPYLASKMAQAHVRGFQGKELGGPESLLACAKHFAGYANASGGRDYDAVYLPETQLRNLVFPPFKAAIDAGAATVMSAYMDLNNIPATANKWLLETVLRNEWGFDGFVVTDASGVSNLVTQGHARNLYEASEKAFKAGTDMDMGSMSFLDWMESLVQDGKVTEKEIDRSVLRILTIKLRMGLFEHPYADEEEISEEEKIQFRVQARKSVQHSIVLLKNENDVLPLKKNLKKIAIVGPLADAQDALEGIMGMDNPPQAITVLDGIREKCPDTEIIYEPGPWIKRTGPSAHSDIFPDFSGKREKAKQTSQEAKKAFERALSAAANAEVVIAVMGETDDMSGEASSRANLGLPGDQQALLEAIAKLGKPVILVLVGGRPLSVTWAAEHIDAILEAWQPGWEGGHGIADVLFGDYNPSGKLPLTVVRESGQCPMSYFKTLSNSPEISSTGEFRSRYWDSDSRPLFPFGYGLSYTTFSYENLMLDCNKIAKGETASVLVTVHNTGKRDGNEIVQLYIHQRFGSDTRPVRELKGFQKVHIPAGESITVNFHLGPEELSYWSSSKNDWIQEDTICDIWVGSNSKAEAHTELICGELEPEKTLERADVKQLDSYDSDATIERVLATPSMRAIIEKEIPELLGDENIRAIAASMSLEQLMFFLPSPQLKQKVQGVIEQLKSL